MRNFPLSIIPDLVIHVFDGSQRDAKELLRNVKSNLKELDKNDKLEIQEYQGNFYTRIQSIQPDNNTVYMDNDVAVIYGDEKDSRYPVTIGNGAKLSILYYVDDLKWLQKYL